MLLGKSKRKKKKSQPNRPNDKLREVPIPSEE